MLLFLSACTTKVAQNETDFLGSLRGGGLLQLDSLEELNYTTTSSTLLIKGKNFLADETPLTTIRFHSDSACTSSPLGEGTNSNFESTGIQLQVSSTLITEIYLTTNTNDICVWMATYDPLHLPPSPPVFGSFSPNSPSKTTYKPFIFGSVSRSTETVRIYDDSSCSHLVGSGAALLFTGTGVPLTLSQNQISTVYAMAVEPFGSTSACTLMASYRHDSTVADPPAFTSIQPTSPNNTSLTPIITGTVNSGITNISIFKDSACSQHLATGTAGDFTGSGIEVTVPEKQSTTLWAQALDDGGHSSFCTYLTTYIHDLDPPAVPGYISATPVSPTNATLYPKLNGTLGSDAASIRFYNNALCTREIGAGTRSDYLGSGIPISVTSNKTIQVYGKSYDAAGNGSSCTYLTDFTNDTIPPETPFYSATNPPSPTNKSITPFVTGGVTEDTVSVTIFSDANCSVSIGSGTNADFMGSGIQVNANSNAITTLYAVAYDVVGNGTECTYLTTYDHSTAIPPAPVYTTSYPASPSNMTDFPFLTGSITNIITEVKFYSDSACAHSTGYGTARNFKSTGVGARVVRDAITPIYSTALDKYGNESACTFFTNYTYTTIIPTAPSFTSFTPNSPTKITPSPFVTGQAINNPVAIIPTTKVNFYDSNLCLNRIGTGPSAAFSTTGIQIFAGANGTTSVYAKALDDAGNGSPCTSMGNFTHDALVPGRPMFLTTTPASPSYARETVLKGYFGPNTDFLPRTTVSIYTDPACANLLTVAPAALLNSTGIPLVMPYNETTPLYGITTNLVETNSSCSFLTNFRHSPYGATNLTAIPSPNGSVLLNWFPDFVANPMPTYTIRRSTQSGGPYTTLNESYYSSYRDFQTKNHTTYYYTVVAKNNTGESLYSNELAVTVNVTKPSAPTNLIATPGFKQIALSWNNDYRAASSSIFRSQTPNGPYTMIASKTTLTSYIDTNVFNDNPYYYVILSSNPDGESGFSSEASAVPKGYPPEPTRLTGAWTGNCVNLTWGAPSFYHKYNIHMGSTSGNESIIDQTTDHSYQYCNGGGSSPDYALYFFVTADWGGVPGTASNEIVLNNTSASLTATPGNNFIKLTWSPGTSVAAAPYYRVKRATSAAGPYTLLTMATTTSYTDAAVSNGTAYFYTVEPWYDLSGIQVGKISNVANAVPAANPSAPSNLNITITNNQPNLFWTAPSNYLGFKVYRAAAAVGPWSVINTGGSISTNSYTDATPATGMNYYRVTAIWGTTETTASNVVSFRNGITASITATGSITPVRNTITWTAVTGASSYTLKRATTSGGPYSTVFNNAVSPYIDTTVVTNTGYYYIVNANFADGTSGQPSVEASAQPGSSKVPNGLTVTGYDSSNVNLSWPKVIGATRYYVYMGTTSGTYYTNPTMLLSTSIQIPNLSPNFKYYFAVTSYGTTESAKSTEVSVTTREIPTAPSVVVGGTSVDVSWGALTGGPTFNLERSTDGINFSSIASGLTDFSFTDTGLTPGQIYCYRIGAVYSGGVTLYSPSSGSVTPGITPKTPNGIGATSNTSGSSLGFIWSAVTGTTSYNFYTYNSGVYTLYGNRTTNDITISGLTEGTPISVAVTALNGTNESGYSDIYTVIPTSIPSAPNAIMVGSALKVDWSTVTGALSYDLQRSTDGIQFSTIVAGMTTLTYSDTALTAGQIYYYRYRPNFSGGLSGTESNVSYGITPVNSLLAPTKLTVNSDGTSMIHLNWVQSPQTIKYNLFRSNTSGGPYTLLGSVNPPLTSYSDTAVSAGQTYYYVATAVNDSGVNSDYSNEVSMNLGVLTPTGLVGVVTNGKIQLSWNPVAGASAYIIKRTIDLSTEYSIIYSGNSVTYQDKDILNQQQYHYTVATLYPTGEVSDDSQVVSLTGIATLNLESPIELTDQPLASDVNEIEFFRTQTTIDPEYYDGTVSYSLEAIALNLDTSDRTIQLIKANGATVGSLTVPANTTEATRIRIPINVTNPDKYRIKTDATTQANQLQVFSARVWVKQINASATRLYFPLLSKNGVPTSSDSNAPIATTSSASYIDIASASRFIRDTTKQALIDEENPWELEAVVKTSQETVGAFALINSTKNSMVEYSETFFYATSQPVVSTVPIEDGVGNFGNSNEEDQYRISIRCGYKCDNSVSIYKAGLWLSVSDISKAQILVRNSLGLTNTTGKNELTDGRTLIDPSVYTNPLFHFQATASHPQGGTLLLQLMDAGYSDVGLSGLQAISGTQLNFVNSASQAQRTSSPISLPAGKRVISEVESTSNGGNLVDSTVVISISR